MKKIYTLGVISLFSAALILFVPFSVAQAKIYKCVNSEGLATYKDSPCGSSSTLKNIIQTESLPKTNLNYDVEISKNTILGKNLLLNSSFENNLIDWRVPRGGYWTKNGGIKKSAALVMQAGIPAEDKYIHETKVQQCVLLNDAKKFGLYAMFRHTKEPEKLLANRANVTWYETADCTTGGQFGSYIEPKKYINGWQELRNDRLKPALGAKAALITIVQRGRYALGNKALWDNISFEAVEVFQQSKKRSNSKSLNDNDTLPLGINYIKNGSFKRNVDGWRGERSKYVTWIGIQGDTHPGAAKIDAVSKTGSIGSGGISQCVNIGGNKNYTLGGSFKREEHSIQKGYAALRLTWYGGKDCSGGGKTINRSQKTKQIVGWQRLKIEDLKPPFKAKSAVIEIIKVVSGKGTFTAYWDDVYFIATE